MGTKSKPPVEIESNGGGTEVQPLDGLPLFQRYIDVSGTRGSENYTTRVFFVTPSDEEIADTTTRYQSKKTLLAVIGAKMPYFSHHNIPAPLFLFCKSKGFPDEFATDIVRLVIRHLKGRLMGPSNVSLIVRQVANFVDFLSTRSHMPLVLTDISKRDWVDYLELFETSTRTDAKTRFNAARSIFKSYEPTALAGWLEHMCFRRPKRKRSLSEHTSELAEARDYPDCVMYQLLALFIEGFQRRIGYLKRYERLTVADMPENWVYPGRGRRYLSDGMVKGTRGLLVGAMTESSQLIDRWLNDENDGYEILIDHFIMHHKLSQKKSGGQRSIKAKNTMLNKLHARRHGPAGHLVSKFLEEMGRRHGYSYLNSPISFLNFYVKKQTESEKNYVINQIGWCLANLLMMQTGVNKEVILSIPSKSENGESILTRGDTLFLSADGATKEIELYGLKQRTGNAPIKVIPVVIVKNSPLYEMLVDYERYVKVSDGTFFEFTKVFKDMWNEAGGSSEFTVHYPVVDEKGKQVSSIDTSRFRKVFASGQLLDRLKGIKDGNELAERLREDLNHGSLDTTLTHYLLRSTIAQSVIDTAIATITSEKLEEGLKFRGRIAQDEAVPYKKKVFLCHCADPQNPSHDVAIADECRHYDLCLGCEQSVITKEHLPYICLRIIQYEAEREKDPYIWPAMFENRWCIAHDALEKYVLKDKKNGRHLVDGAWDTAKDGRVSLPPIIVSNRI